MLEVDYRTPEEIEQDEAIEALSRLGEQDRISEFFAYQTIGAAIGNVSAISRVDFQ